MERLHQEADGMKEFYIERRFSSPMLYVGMMEISNNKTHIMRVSLEEVPEDEAISDPSLTLKWDEAQKLIDELWRVGLRPTEGTGSAGSLAATEKHLKDMQKIAFFLLEK